MHLLPVIDLQRGMVVRGVAGQRHLYQPVVSQLVANADPATVARAFTGLGFHDTYVADLDAIQGAPPAWNDYLQLATAGLRIWLDAGVTSIDRVRTLLDWRDGAGVFAAIIVGTESLRDASLLPKILAVVGADRVVLSIDLRAGELVAAADTWRHANPLEVAQQSVDWGCRRLLVLDVAAVGTARGVPTGRLCRELRERFSDVELVSGGGIRGAEDVAELERCGCDRVLVASALHDRRLP